MDFLAINYNNGQCFDKFVFLLNRFKVNENHSFIPTTLNPVKTQQRAGIHAFSCCVLHGLALTVGVHKILFSVLVTQLRSSKLSQGQQRTHRK